MFRLVITKESGEHYWTEHFEHRADLDAWLEEERTRVYWDPKFEITILDLTPTPPTQAEIDAKKAAELAKEAELKTIKNLVKKGAWDSVELQKVVLELTKKVFGA